MLRRSLAALVLVVGLAASAVAFLIGAPTAAGIPLGEGVDTVCFDPWTDAHPGDHEPEVDGYWSWWPPGITCVHASGAVYVEPSRSDATAVGMFGLAVLIFGVAPTLLVVRSLWQDATPCRVAQAAVDG